MKSIGLIILAGCMSLMSVNAQAQGNATTPAVTVESEKPYTWTLQDCIDWAKQQSITVQRRKVNVRSSQVELKDAKANRLPTVDFTTYQNVSNRPFQESYSGVVGGSEVVTFNNKNSYSGNYSLGASMNLYNGGVTKNNIRLAEINTQIAELNVTYSELNIVEQITQLYVQILYSQDAVNHDDELIAIHIYHIAQLQFWPVDTITYTDGILPCSSFFPQDFTVVAGVFVKLRVILSVEIQLTTVIIKLVVFALEELFVKFFVIEGDVGRF